MSDANSLVYICVHCGQVVENKDSEWHERQCPGKHVNVDDDQEDIELNVEEIEEETQEEKQVEKDDYVLRLINAVRLRTQLWDKFQKRDFPARRKLWEEIEQELGTQPDVPRRDWTHLREKYRGERTTLKKAAQSGRKVAPRWEYYENMTFLEQDGVSRAKKSVLPKPTPKLVVSPKVVTINGKKVIKRNLIRGKPGPKPGNRKTVKKPVTKPVSRPKRDPKPPAHLAIQQPQTVNTISNARKFGQLSELRVVVPRNDYRDFTAKKIGNSVTLVNDSNSRKRSNVNSQQDVDVIACKQVCIRSTEETPMNSTNNDDTVGRFCSYLEVMLRTLPKEKQEVFYEETLDHLATLKRQIRRSNHSNPATNYIHVFLKEEIHSNSPPEVSQNELASLRDRKSAMLALNVSTHRLLTDVGSSASPAFAGLKDGVADLYRIWDEIVQKGNQQLCALQAVQQFAARLNELQCALRRDKDALAVLDAALQAGATTEVASSVRDVARLLSEKQDANYQNGSILDETLKEDSSDTGSKFGDTTVIGLAQEGGSLSDSGISDSGSEQELSERERRLAALRRLTRTLESQLAPGSEALAELWKRVEDAEAELRTLQKQCRELIVRTAASVESRGSNRATIPLNFPIPIKRKKIPMDLNTDNLSPKLSKEKLCTDSGDPESEPGEPTSWIWRILRAALPFQLALVALFCAACLLEPHCCEAANTLNLSLTPQLRYVRGPPPV